MTPLPAGHLHICGMPRTSAWLAVPPDGQGLAFHLVGELHRRVSQHDDPQDVLPALHSQALSDLFVPVEKQLAAADALVCVDDDRPSLLKWAGSTPYGVLAR